MLDKVAHFEELTHLSVQRTYQVLDESRSIVLNHFIVGKVCPVGIDFQLRVLATAVDSCVVLVHHVLTLLSVGLQDGFLHLVDSEVDGNHARDAEECRLQNGVGAVAKSNFASYLCGIDDVNRDIVLSEETFHLVGDEADEFVALKDGVEQERSVLLQTAGHVIHVEIGLYVASYEVGRCHEIGGADGRIAKAQV